MVDYALQHHGVKGQKWGIHRTPEQLGHKRRWKRQDKSSEENKERKKLSEEEKETRKNMVLKSRSAKLLYENADLFDYQELQSAYNRLQLERNIKNLSPKDISRGEAFVNNYIKVSNKTSEVTESSTRLYNNMAKIYNAANPDHPWPLIKDADKKKK